MCKPIVLLQQCSKNQEMLREQPEKTEKIRVLTTQGGGRSTQLQPTPSPPSIIFCFFLSSFIEDLVNMHAASCDPVVLVFIRKCKFWFSLEVSQKIPISANKCFLFSEDARPKIFLISKVQTKKLLICQNMAHLPSFLA